MSNLKKVVSLLLCLSMLAGIFTVLGGTLAPTASALKLEDLPAEPVINKVKTVQELNAEYGDEGYYYLGLEFYEADGNLTDGYVNAGDELTVKVYVKSPYYVYKVATNYAFDRNFFDISNLTSGLTYDTTGNNGNNAEDDGTNNTGIYYPTEANGKSYYYNKTNQVGSTINGIELKYAIKALWAGNDSYYFTDGKNGGDASSKLGIDLATVRSWDLIEISNLVRKDSTKKGLILNTDESLLEFKIKVRDDLAEGTTGDTILRLDTFRICDHVNGDSVTARRSDVTLGKEETGETVTMKDEAFITDYVSLDNFDFEDCNNTFIVGTNPVPEGKYFARFVDNDGEIIGTDYYAAGEDVTLPETRENFFGWANLATGKVEATTSLTMPASNVTYKAIYSTDKFKVTLDCDGGKIDENDKVEVELSYGEELDLSKYVPVKAYNEFMGWKPSTFKMDNINSTNVTAIWSETVYTINFMVMDYATGEWVVYETKTGKYADAAITRTQFTQIAESVTPSDVNWDGSFGTVPPASKIRAEDGTNYVKDIVFDADKNFYISTVLQYNVTVKIPKFDETSYAYTDEYTTTVLTVDSAINTGVANVKLTSDEDINAIAPKSGYSMDGWFDADNNRAPDSAVGQFSLSADKGSTVTYCAKFSVKEYKVRFAFKIDTEFAYWENTVKVGDVLDFSEGKITYTGTSTVFELQYPVVGLEASEQPGAAETGITWKDPGYKLNGWYLKSWTDKEPVDSTTVLTGELIEKYIDYNPKTSDTLSIYGDWEALEYNLEFYYKTPESDPDFEEKPYKVISLPVGTNIGGYTKVTGEEKADLNENAPVGYYFSNWQNDNKSESGYTISNMVKGGLKVYAKYYLNRYSLYIDYNNGQERSIQTYGYGIEHGSDIEYQDPEVDANRGDGVSVRKMTIYESSMPGSNYVHIGWKVFYLDDPADINDSSKWHEGYNDKGDGSTNVYTPVVYQAQWLPYSELFFRTYDTYGNLYSVLTKSFKRYYWHSGAPCDKEDAALNAFPDTQFIAFIKPSLENFEWSGFFSAEMWSNVSLRFDAVGLANGTFSPENIVQLIKLLISVIKGEEELPEL